RNRRIGGQAEVLAVVGVPGRAGADGRVDVVREVLGTGLIRGTGVFRDRAVPVVGRGGHNAAVELFGIVGEQGGRRADVVRWLPLHRGRGHANQRGSGGQRV